MDDVRQQYARAVDALNCGQWSAAFVLAEQLSKLVPEHGGVHFVAGVAAMQLQRIPEALQHLQRAVHFSPNRADYAAQFARVLTMMWLTREALVAANAALDMNPSDPVTLDTLAIVFTQANEHAKAVVLFERAARLVPRNAATRFNLATAHTFNGNLEQAEQEYEACLALDSGYWKAHLALAQLRKATRESNHVGRLRALLDTGNEPISRMYLNLALAKELEDLADYPSAFSHLVAGKTAGGEGRSYQSERDAKLFSAIRHAFSAPLDTEAGCLDSSPIFVVGLPRSGTTLVDRILSSHPQVHSAGELQNFGMVLKRASGSHTSELLDADTIERAAHLDFKMLGEAYVVSTRPGTSVKPKFVDKLPHNFLYLGYIALALPNARIVCLRRNPMDSCLGNFRQLFAQGTTYYDYSFDLLDTGRYYLLFDALMRHWQQVLPGRILEVHYEDLVTDQRAVTERLLAHCGLEWDERCLHFDSNVAPVSTASAVQVRQPLFRDAMYRWKRYQNELTELQALLESAGLSI